MELAATAATAVALPLALLVAPADHHQGNAQRLMYVHVPAAWVAYAAFFAVLVASVAFLLTGAARWDRVAGASAEVGVGLTVLTLLLGSVWGRATWGVWWPWDARLITTLLLLLVYVGYLTMRSFGGSPADRTRRAAVCGIVGFAAVPLVHFSVVWWRTLHQPPTVLAPQTSAPLDPTMAVALAASVLAFSLLALSVVRRRVRVLRGGSTGAATPAAAEEATGTGPGR